jgi:hypothetical protein
MGFVVSVEWWLRWQSDRRFSEVARRLTLTDSMLLVLKRNRVIPLRRRVYVHL